MNLGKHAMLGGFLVACILILTGLTLYLRDLSLKQRTAWTVYFGGDSIVEEGFEVWSSGMKVGIVAGVEPVPDREFTSKRQVRATVKIDADLKIWKDGALVVRPRGMLGGFRAELVRGTPGAGELVAGQPLPGRVEPGAFTQIRAMVRENREGLNQITDNLADVTGAIRRGEGSFGAFVRDEKLYKDFSKVARNLVEFTDRLNAPDSSVGRFMRDDELYDDFKRGIRNLADITEKINSGKGNLGRLLNDDTMIREFERGLSGIAELATDLQSGEGALGLLLKDKQTRDDVAAAIQAVREFTQALNSGDGTIPMLLRNREVYDDIRVVSAKVRAIAEDIHAGKGTLGKFLSDDGVYDELLRMLESFRESGDIVRENAPLSSLTSFASLFFNVLN